jgi:hypothetical protein
VKSLQANCGGCYTFFTSSGGGQIRPNRVGEANTSIDPRVDRFHFLNINAFSLQAINTPGNSARNVAWGPQCWNVDSGITKRFPITEQKYFDFRFEAFNLFNHVNFQPPPVTNWTAAGFGQITTSYPARQVQIAVRFAF